MQDIEESKKKGGLFCNDSKLTQIFFNKINEYQPFSGGLNDTMMNDNVRYFRKENQPYVACECSFEYEQKEAIQELLHGINQKNNNTNN